MSDSLPKPINKMLVKELQEELKKRGMDTKGLKADLVKRLSQVLEKPKEDDAKPMQAEPTSSQNEDSPKKEEVIHTHLCLELLACFRMI